MQNDARGRRMGRFPTLAFALLAPVGGWLCWLIGGDPGAGIVTAVILLFGALYDPGRRISWRWRLGAFLAVTAGMGLVYRYWL